MFEFCCQLVRVIGENLGLSYYEINTYLFLMVQPIIYIGLGIMLCMLFLKLLNVAPSPQMFVFYGACFLIALVQCFVFAHVVHLGFILDPSEYCKLAMNDMVTLGHSVGVSYEDVNYIIFMLLFLAITLGDAFILFAGYCKYTQYKKMKYELLHVA